MCYTCCLHCHTKLYPGGSTIPLKLRTIMYVNLTYLMRTLEVIYCYMVVGRLPHKTYTFCIGYGVEDNAL